MTLTLVVGVATRRRPKMLARCLAELARQKTGITFVVVVADNNDPGDTETAEVIADARRAGGVAIVPVRVEKRGIASARNGILEVAERLEAEFVAFIDDDEWPGEDWVDMICGAAEYYAADVIYGPVFLRHDPVRVSWTDGRTQKKWPPLPEGCITEHASTCNVLVSRRIWGCRPGELDMRFDTAYDLTGGEDSVFFAGVHRSGARMVWSNFPVVFERVPASRQSFQFFLSQHVQRGMTGEQMKRDGHLPGIISPSSPMSCLGQVARHGFALISAALDDTLAKKERMMIAGSQMATAWGRFRGSLGGRSRFYEKIHGE